MAERLCGKCFTEHGPYSCPLGNGWVNQAYHEGVAAGRAAERADVVAWLPDLALCEAIDREEHVGAAGRAALEEAEHD